MADGHNIKTFAAADIERYHKGLMSSRERHAMEKAALDDPFLADALEGYDVNGVNINDDITDLKNRLAKRTREETKLVPFVTGKITSFPLWKVAAMFLLIAGAGLIVYQFGFNNKSRDIAQARALKKDTIKAEANDSNDINSFTRIDSGKNSSYIMPGQEYEVTKPEIDKVSPDTSAKGSVASNSTTEKRIIGDTVAQTDLSSTISTQPNRQDDTQKETLNNINLNKVSAEKEEELNAKKNNSDITVAQGARQKRSIAPGQAKETNYKTSEAILMNRPNVFRGRVTDANNNALPFSNITNLEDNVGTYTDAGGYFNLTSPDSLLNVQVRSLGFESNNVQLRNTLPEHKVLLEEDRSLSARVLDTVKRNTNRLRNNTMVLEEPEPVDGWSNYDMYLVNNLKVPESFRTRQTNGGEVELSFEVDKNGEPVNITVKKSLCESCDREAIRLIKEGPKWKRKIKKGKATVTVSF